MAPLKFGFEAEFSGRWSVDEQKQRMGRITFSGGSGGWRGTRPREQRASLRLIEAAHATIHHGQRNGCLLLGHFFLYFLRLLLSRQWLSLRSPLYCCPRLGVSDALESSRPPLTSRQQLGQDLGTRIRNGSSSGSRPGSWFWNGGSRH